MSDISASPSARPFAPRILIRALIADPLAATGLCVLTVLVLVGILAPWIAPQNPYDLGEIDILDAKLEPGSHRYDGLVYWLGTDGQGRDMLSAILYGLRISLFVGATSAIIAAAIGTALGLAATYSGRWFDTVLMRFVDFQLSLPTVLIALVLIVILGRGVDKIIIALVAIQWAYYARTVRGSVLVELGKEYVEAARCLILPRSRIMFRHILPNCIAPLLVVLTIQVGHAITLEASLSFLGLGMPVTEPSLGMLISNGFQHLMNGRYWISVFPGVALLITVVSINLIGDHLRDLLNPRLQN
jgi:peptide/nickel transport system permease protein